MLVYIETNGESEDAHPLSLLLIIFQLNDSLLSYKTATRNTYTSLDSPRSYPPTCNTSPAPRAPRLPRISPYTPRASGSSLSLRSRQSARLPRSNPSALSTSPTRAISSCAEYPTARTKGVSIAPAGGASIRSTRFLLHRRKRSKRTPRKRIFPGKRRERESSSR